MATEKIIDDLNKIEGKLKNPVLTIGNFDGVHRGHVALFDRVKELARNINGQSAVMTFTPHPIKVVKPGNGPSLITRTRQKLDLISQEGIDAVICLPFTSEFASISAEDFVTDLLVKKIGVKELVVGYDYTFGAGRKGNINLLRDMGAEQGFNVHMIDPIYLSGTLVSSTSIRNLVKEGNLKEAKRLLGRDYHITGTVASGTDRGGKVLGFPTANIVPEDELIPRKGVYAVSVELGEKTYQGVCNIGHNPTFGNNSLTIETHILDFSGNIVGEQINITFLQHMRNEKIFTSVQELADQIAKDIKQAKELFNLYGSYQST